MIGSGEELWVIRNSPFHSFDEMPATQKSSLRLAADSSCRGCAATASQSNYEGIPFILPNFSFCFSHLQSSFINPSKCRNLGRDQESSRGEFKEFILFPVVDLHCCVRSGVPGEAITQQRDWTIEKCCPGNWQEDTSLTMAKEMWATAKEEDNHLIPSLRTAPEQ